MPLLGRVVVLMSRFVAWHAARNHGIVKSRAGYVYPYVRQDINFRLATYSSLDEVVVRVAANK